MRQILLFIAFLTIVIATTSCGKDNGTAETYGDAFSKHVVSVDNRKFIWNGNRLEMIKNDDSYVCFHYEGDQLQSWAYHYGDDVDSATITYWDGKIKVVERMFSGFVSGQYTYVFYYDGGDFVNKIDVSMYDDFIGHDYQEEIFLKWSNENLVVKETYIEGVLSQRRSFEYGDGTPWCKGLPEAYLLLDEQNIALPTFVLGMSNITSEELCNYVNGQLDYQSAISYTYKFDNDGFPIRIISTGGANNVIQYNK